MEKAGKPMIVVRKILHGQKTEEAMGIKFLKQSKPESERVEDDAKVRIKVEELSLIHI